jgi:hypothetical protein
MAQPTREDLLNCVGDFTWSFFKDFFVKTPYGGYVWSDPDYYGDNTFTKYPGSYSDWAKTLPGGYGRAKSQHVIRKYCGDDIVVK